MIRAAFVSFGVLPWCVACDDSIPPGSNARVHASASAASSAGEAPRSTAPAPIDTSASPRVFAPSPAELMKRAPKVLGVALGSSKQELEKTIGPCEAHRSGSCIYWSRGVEFELAGGVVQRAIAHAADDGSALRGAGEPGEGRFEKFGGELAGVRIGKSLKELEEQLPGPTQHLRAVPNGADPSGNALVYEYSKLALAVEVEEGMVVRIHVPIAPARARDLKTSGR